MKLSDVVEMHDDGPDAEQYHKMLLRYVKIVGWLTAVLFLTTIFRLFWYYQIEQSIEQLDTQSDIISEQTNLARDAAVEARDTLQKALDEADSRRGSDPGAIANALQAIDRIERQLCGGPCDQP